MIRPASQILFLIAATILMCSAGTTWTQPKPTPAPRRRLPRPVTGTRGLDQYTVRDASARLIAASSTRRINDEAAPSYNLGNKNFAAGKYEEAARYFTQAVKLDPNSVEARYALGLSLMKASQLEAAIDSFKILLQLDPANELKIWADFLIGNSHAELGQYEQAIKPYQDAIRLDPKLSKPHNNLGLAYAALDRSDDAIAEFTQAVQNRPDYAEAQYNLGVAYLHLGRIGEARRQQHLLLKLDAKLAQRLADLLKK